MRDQAGELADGPTDDLTQLIDQCLFYGRGPGPHFIHGHDLVGDRANGIEEPGNGYGSGDLVPHITWVVQIVAVCQCLTDKRFEMLGQVINRLRSTGLMAGMLRK